MPEQFQKKTRTYNPHLFDNRPPAEPKTYGEMDYHGAIKVPTHHLSFEEARIAYFEVTSFFEPEDWPEDPLEDVVRPVIRNLNTEGVEIRTFHIEPFMFRIHFTFGHVTKNWFMMKYEKPYELGAAYIKAQLQYLLKCDVRTVAHNW